MEFDPASLFALALCSVFLGAIVWAEVHSRRRRRHPTPTTMAPDMGDEPFRRGRPESET